MTSSLVFVYIGKQLFTGKCRIGAACIFPLVPFCLHFVYRQFLFVYMQGADISFLFRFYFLFVSFGYSKLDTGYLMLDIGYWMLKNGILIRVRVNR